MDGVGFVGANDYSPNTPDSSIFIRFPFLRHCRAKNLLPLRNQKNLGGLGWPVAQMINDDKIGST